MLLCNRLHVKEVDFNSDTARFIVSKTSGLNVNGQHLTLGDEIPRGVLTDIALRQIYDTPLRLIETIEYARQDPLLVEACTRQGTLLEDPPAQTQEPEVITVMCDECGEFYPDNHIHTKKECKRNQKGK